MQNGIKNSENSEKCRIAHFPSKKKMLIFDNTAGMKFHKSYKRQRNLIIFVLVQVIYSA